MTGSPGETQNTASSTADIAGATPAGESSPQPQPGEGAVAAASQPPSEPQSTQTVSSEQLSATQAAPAQDAASSGAEDHIELMESTEAEGYRSQWTAIQVTFVDEPRRAVESADALVADVMKRLAESFAQERSRLESQWDRGDDVSTEELRLALQRYRSFFNRLLTT